MVGVAYKGACPLVKTLARRPVLSVSRHVYWSSASCDSKVAEVILKRERSWIKTVLIAQMDVNPVIQEYKQTTFSCSA